MSIDAVRRYHDGTKHDFNRFARSLGYLDWASQPNPFRSFDGGPIVPLDRLPLPDPAPCVEPVPASPFDTHSVSRLLRYSLGLSAWKSLHPRTGLENAGEGAIRWSLRVNPSSGNLHPTEGYLVVGSADRIAPGVYHYAPERHLLEQRCVFTTTSPPGMFVGLSSIPWREAWKYGERAFRYCQHDIGHAVVAVRIAAALEGWSANVEPSASSREIAAILGLDRDRDFADAEHEEPECLISVNGTQDIRAFVEAARTGTWFGRPNQLSRDHVQWTFIDEIAAATVDPGHASVALREPASPALATYSSSKTLPDRSLLLRRRSAVAFDGSASIGTEAFVRIVRKTLPDSGCPFDALWWPPHIHLVLFVHRVDGLASGLYCLPRDPEAVVNLKVAFGREFLWEPASVEAPLWALARGDCRRLAARVSCDQEIAGDGVFSLGMLADFERGLATFGPSFYRNLFWEAGAVGQALYLAAEAEGVRGTGIGCFYDDPVHAVLGIGDPSFQSLYHFAVGKPVEDSRLTTEPGYEWEGIGLGGGASAAVPSFR